ncbi:MAG: LamG domain-containing protein, partial [Trichodesmium sp. St18_bin1]|nr:LamG domain-containing protein [Trichodesmium sp. St18_bin1]
MSLLLLTLNRKKITGPSPNDLHNIYVASNTSSTSPIDETPPPPMDINRGLQLHLLLNEIVENAESEKEVVDISGAQLNGKVDGATVVADSKFGHCINFDGVDDYIQMPEMNVDYSQGLTVAAWVHYNSFKRWSRIIDFGNAQANDNIVFGNQLTTNNLALVVLKGSNDNRIKADGRLELNQWLYVTVTVDGSGSGKIYKNGEEVQSGLVHLPNTVNRTKNYIGKSNWSADKYFHGQMSNLRLYNRGLSKAEINECMKVDVTPPPSMAGEDDTTPTTDGTETTSTTGEDGTTPTTDGTETTSTTGDNDTTPTTDDIETTPTTNEGNTDPTSTA